MAVAASLSTCARRAGQCDQTRRGLTFGPDLKRSKLPDQKLLLLLPQFLTMEEGGGERGWLIS